MGPNRAARPALAAKIYFRGDFFANITPFFRIQAKEVARGSLLQHAQHSLAGIVLFTPRF